jgi:hypothetical protein
MYGAHRRSPDAREHGAERFCFDFHFSNPPFAQTDLHDGTRFRAKAGSTYSSAPHKDELDLDTRVRAYPIRPHFAPKVDLRLRFVDDSSFFHVSLRFQTLE